MPIGLGNNMRSLSGLSAADRTEEEKKVIEEQKNASSGTSTGTTTPASVQAAGTQNIPTVPKQSPVQKPVQQPAQNTEQDSEPSFWSNIFTPVTEVLNKHKDEIDKHKADRERNKSAYQKALDAQNFKWGVGRGSVNSTAEDYVDKISKDVSSSYKKFNGTDKLPLDNEEKKKIAAEYDARKQVFGEQSANNWLDAKYKNTVADNQSWWEQALNSTGHFIPTMEGAAVSLAGMATGSIAYISNNIGITDFEDYNGNENLGWWEGFLDATMDNPITRYGNKLERAGASHVSDALKLIGLSDKTAAEKIAEWESTKTKSNPEGISDDAVLTTTEQDNSFINATTPWQALYSGGFTAFSMLVGAGEAKAAGWLFNGVTKGVNWANKAGVAFKTEKALEKGLEAARYIQKAVDTFVIPGLVGTIEGAQEGLQAKMDVEREAKESFDEEYKTKMAEEAKALFESEELNPMIEERTDRGKVMRRKYRTYNEALQATINSHLKDYKDIQDQIDWAASKAGIHTFYANSLINGMINSTLKAGIMSSRVQEALRRNRLTGWWYRDFGFDVDDAGKAVVKTPKWKMATDIIKEPLGEGFEEYAQTVSSNTFTGSAENNIGEFIKAKYSADGTVKVGDTFSSDYAAAWTAFTNSLTSKESIQSATIGAVSSVMGTFSTPGRGYHRDSQGRLVQNSLFSPRNFTKSLNEKGEQESTTEYLRRITPWRSGAVNAYFDYKKEKAEAEETADLLTEWLKDPQNKAKWDGLVGTSEWLTSMEKASENNDQFSYRKAQMGKAVNDVFMLSKLKGTQMYDAIMEDLQRSATMKAESEEAQGYIEKLRANKGEELEGKTDEEIIEKINKNANEMLGLMSQIEKEGNRLDTMLGKIDDDTKQSLIYGKLMEKDFTARKEQLESEINEIKAKIANSRGVSNVQLEDDLKKLIAEHGSLNAALKAQSQWEEVKNKAQEKVKELEKIDKDKRSDKQNKELENNKNFIKKADKELATFDALYKKDENGKVTKEIDSSLAQLVLNEQEIMELDAQARSRMLRKGASQFYNATHQDRQKVDELNLELDELNAQIESLEEQNDSWKDSSGRVKKGHNKQVVRNNAKIKELTKQKEEKMRALHNEQNKMDTKEYFSDAQQAVIDNLVQQGTAIDEDFVDKIVDYGRLDDGIKAYHSQYQAILSDPKLFQNYVQRAKLNAKNDLTRRKASYVANLQDYKEFSQELDKLMADASPIDQHIILSTLREENKKQKDATRKRVQDEALDRWENEDDGELVQDDRGNVSVVLNEEQRQAAEAPTNIDKYIENSQKAASLVQHFSNVEGLTSNDKSLLADAFQYLASNGIDLTDRNAVVEALANPDERGNIGGTFRQYVESLNSKRIARQETVVPTFTSTGQVVSQYVELLDYLKEEEKTRQATSVRIEVPSAPTVATQDETPASAAPSGGGILDGIMGTSPDDGQLVGDDQVVRTGAIADAEKKSSDEESIEDGSSRTDIEKAFLGLVPAEVFKNLSTVENIIANTKGSDEAKEIAKKYFIDIADALSGDDNSLDDITSELSDKIEALHKESDAQINDDNVYSQAASILTNVHKKLQVQNKRAEANAQSTAEQNRSAMSSTIQTLDMNYYKEHYPNSWAVEFSDEHKIEQWLKDNYPLSANTPIYFITDSEWTSKVIESVGKDVYVSGQMPVVAAVHVDEPKDKNHTTAIEVDGLWYQPVGILPANEGKTRGAKRCEVIRRLASSETGRSIITEDGTPDGKPLTTVVSGTGNYLHANVNKELKRKGNTENTDFFEAIIETLPEQEKERLRAMPRRDVLDDEVYKNKRADFVRRLIWKEDKDNVSGLNIHVVPNNYNGKGEGQPMGVIRKSLKDSVSRTSGKSLKEVLEGEDLDEVVSFNSLTQGVYDNVIRPLFMYSMMDQVRHKNPINARIITKEDAEKNPSAHIDEALRIQKVLNGYDGSKESNGLRGVRSFIHLRYSDKAGEKWSFVVKPSTESVEGEDTNTSKTIFDIYLKEEVGGKEVKIGSVQAGAKDSEGAKELLRNLLWDSEKGEIRGILEWQVSKRDIEAIRDKDSSEAEKEKAVENVSQLVDDGIFEFAGYSLDPYEANYITIKAPSTNNVNAPVNPQVVTANAGNAATPMPSGSSDGAVVTTDGEEVEPDSGMVVGSGGNAQGTGHGTGTGGSQVNRKLEEAKKIVEKIKLDSERFKLSADEKYYYIEDKKTGKREKYLRVTTVIGADNEVEQKVTIPDVLKKLKEKNPNIPTLSEEQIEGIKSSKDVASLLDITEEEVKRAWSEAKTGILKEGYGVWSTPSTSVGNTVDNITRDFFDGTLKDSYPNITQEALQAFTQQLESFKHDLDVKGIHIVSEGVMAFGEITATDENGNVTQVKVAGTLDLLGYDDKGNFYIFDMKTVHDHSNEKLKREKAKWSRQVSMYADLLKQKYGIAISEDRLRIIPINVDYPIPYGGTKTDRLNKRPRYSENDKGQLQMDTSYNIENPEDVPEEDKTDFMGSNPEMKDVTYLELFRPGYHRMDINWDLLSSEDQDIAMEIEDGIEGNKGEGKDTEFGNPQNATINTGESDNFDFGNALEAAVLPSSNTDSSTPPPVVPNGSTLILPSWNDLSDDAKVYLDSIGYYEAKYQEVLDNPADSNALYHQLDCAGVL